MFELTRQQMFSLVGHRTPTIQRLRLGADADGRLTAISHEVVEHTSRINEFAEQTATPTRVLYAAANRRTTHRLARLDVPPPTIMRAPGETPGMFALESAMDELAVALGIDPVELRIRNEPDRDPERDVPWSTRHLVECLRTGAERFGWAGRDLRPRMRTEGRWLIGTGVASATYPTRRRKADCRISVDGSAGRYVVEIDGSDIGTGAWTALSQIAADALGTDLGRGGAADRRQPAAAGRWRGRLDRTGLLGIGDRAHRPRPAQAARRAVRRPGSRRTASPSTAGWRASRRTRRRTRCTPSAPTSSRCGSTRTPARCGCPGPPASTTRARS